MYIIELQIPVKTFVIITIFNNTINNLYVKINDSVKICRFIFIDRNCRFIFIGRNGIG